MEKNQEHKIQKYKILLQRAYDCAAWGAICAFGAMAFAGFATLRKDVVSQLPSWFVWLVVIFAGLSIVFFVGTIHYKLASAKLMLDIRDNM